MTVAPIGANTDSLPDLHLSGLAGSVEIPDSKFLGLLAAPVKRGVGLGLTAKWPRRTDRDDFDFDSAYPHLEPLSESAPSRPNGISFDTDNASLKRWAENIPLAASVINHLRETGVEAAPEAIRTLVTRLRQIHERKVWDLLDDSAAWGASSDPGNINTSSTALIAATWTGIETVDDESEGGGPDSMFMPLSVAKLYAQLDEVKNFNSTGRGVAAISPLAGLATFVQEYFGLTLRIHRGKYRNGTTKTEYIGKNIIIAKTMGPRAWASTIINDEVPAGVNGIVSIREEMIPGNDPRGSKWIGDTRFEVHLNYASSAYALIDVDS